MNRYFCLYTCVRKSSFMQLSASLNKTFPFLSFIHACLSICLFVYISIYYLRLFLMHLIFFNLDIHLALQFNYIWFWDGMNRFNIDVFVIYRYASVYVLFLFTLQFNEVWVVIVLIPLS